MIERAMDIRRKPHSLIEYTAPANADFSPLRVAIPLLNSMAEEEDFRELAQEATHRSCGQTSCESCVVIYFEPLSDGIRFPRKMLTASIQCTVDDCPLDMGGYSGDREPRQPQPPLLSQHAKPPTISE